MMKTVVKSLLTGIIVIFITFQPLHSQSDSKLKNRVTDKMENWQNPLNQWQHISSPSLDSVKVFSDSEMMTLFFAPGLSYYPFREETCDILRESIRKSIGWRFRNYKINVVTNNYSIEHLVPNYFRHVYPVDSSRFPVIDDRRRIPVRKKDDFIPSKGLSGNSIALWHSHGYYFEMTLDRWEFQRAKLFGTVEDIAVMAYVVPYLTRMLENSGASVWLPRERDIQTNEVIVDNDISSGESEFSLYADTVFSESGKGFLFSDTIFPYINPFRQGTSLSMTGDSACYVPDIPEKGYYAVYITYPLSGDNCRNVTYTVCHSGGKTEYIVDQTVGGGTWIYLGTFHFKSGLNKQTGSVRVKGNSADDIIALDAVRFGGGMGNVARKPSQELIRNQMSVNVNTPESESGDTGSYDDFSWKISGMPRFLEAGRYWLQYAGMPDTIVYTPNNYKNDYNDDYQSRGLWVNYLRGLPGEENEQAGLGIDIDLSLAFHTDAGVTSGDSIIGTLAICYTLADEGKFSDGTSRMAGRDFSDIIQTQIVEDIRNNYNAEWTRRGLWDRPYSEARRPDVPAMLLELLSHQNLADMKYNLDPRFRFSVCRSVYKGILKYLAYTENREYIVHPLPVSRFAITPVSGKKVRLSWIPVAEKDEPTSLPDKYRIYSRCGDNGFDNGFIVNESIVEIELPSYDSIYSFKVTALNDGGESFESEILSVGIRNGDTENILIVNGFDRISGPAWFDMDNKAGIEWWNDRGVPYIRDFVTLGDQYDYDRKNPWVDDDAPGWGATYSDMAGHIIPGNSFDYPYIHGKAVLEAGHSFYSVSDEYFEQYGADESNFSVIDFIFGEEKTTPFFNDTLKKDFRIYSPEFMNKVEKATQAGVSIFMSGAYVGSDLFVPGDSSAIKFAKETMHFSHRTDHAVRTGDIYTTDYAKSYFTGTYEFNTGYSASIYQVESPDAIEPAGDGAVCAFRYNENNTSAGAAFNGDYKTVILGFPFETIVTATQRKMLMKQILNYLLQ